MLECNKDYIFGGTLKYENITYFCTSEILYIYELIKHFKTITLMLFFLTNKNYQDTWVLGCAFEI